MSARTVAAAGITAFAIATLMIEAVSWKQSARFGPLIATTLQCSVRLDAVSGADRAAGLRNGDLVLLPRISTAARVAGVYHYTPTQAGRAGQLLSLVVARGNKQIVVPYMLRHLDPLLTFIAQMAFKLTAAGIGFLLLWRGFDRASLLLGAWCASVGIGLPDAWWGALPVDGRIAGGVLTAVLWTSSPFILYLVVEAIAVGVSRAAQLIARGAMLLLMLPALIVNTADATAQALSGCSVIPIAPWVANATFAASQLVIIGFFVLSYARTTGLAKQRVRWVFWAFLISRAGVLLNLLNRLAIHPLHLSGLEWVTVMIFPIGCAYAILRHRIIDVNFVLNRTLVYTLLTSMVVGIFILLEEALKAAAAGRGVGIAVELAVALGIGFSFNAMHKYTEIAIERALFRAKHEAASALRRLAEEAPFMENADALLARAAQEVRDASGAAGTAIYERVDDGYRLTIASGDGDALPLVGVDDLAFVRMRKSREPQDLSELESALGSDGTAFPFSVRGALTGALVCRRRRSGEAYAPDEIALLASVAHEVGAEINAIRARRQAEVLDALLSGSLDLRDARAQLGGT